jgi:hypothetical protein
MALTLSQVAATNAFGGAALVAIGTVAIFSAAGVLFVFGLRPLVVQALDYVDGLPPDQWRCSSGRADGKPVEMRTVLVEGDGEIIGLFGVEPG